MLPPRVLEVLCDLGLEAHCFAIQLNAFEWLGSISYASGPCSFLPACNGITDTDGEFRCLPVRMFGRVLPLPLSAVHFRAGVFGHLSLLPRLSSRCGTPHAMERFGLWNASPAPTLSPTSAFSLNGPLMLSYQKTKQERASFLPALLTKRKYSVYEIVASL